MCCGGFPHYPPQCRGSPAPVTLYFTVTVFICLVLRSLRLAKMCAGFLTQEWVSIRYMSWAGWRGKMRLRCSAPSETTLLCFTAFDSSTVKKTKKNNKKKRYGQSSMCSSANETPCTDFCFKVINPTSSHVGVWRRNLFLFLFFKVKYSFLDLVNNKCFKKKDKHMRHCMRLAWLYFMSSFTQINSKAVLSFIFLHGAEYYLF